MIGIFALGFRHGFDVDHVAAIGDLAGSQFVRARAFVLGVLYGLGHAAMVVLLALGISAAGWEIPNADPVLGATLVVLGAYVLWCAAAGRRPTSRAGAVLRLTRRVRRALRPTTSVEHDHEHRHDGDRLHGHSHDELEARPAPAAVRVGHRHLHRHDDIPAPYTAAGAVAVGAVHGIGAETPTQVIALAAGTASIAPFVAGLLLANTAMALVAAWGLAANRVRALNAVVGAVSVGVGAVYLVG